MTFSKTKKGFTLIETLVGSAVFLMVALTAYGAFGILMDGVASSRAKVAGAAVANEQFEIIRNLPYNDVGIVGGLPIGKIIRNQTLVRDSLSFNILTSIRSTDDPFDGTIGGVPSDSSPADYKLVDLDISCNNCKIFTPLNFTTLVAPHSLETAANNGALFIRVFDSGGLPIQGATVNISNTQANPDITINETTDNDGWIRIVDAPPGTNAYSITATKSGYSEDQTYPLGGGAGPNPLNPDSTVVVQQVTQAVFSIDRTGTLEVQSKDGATCAALPSMGFSLTGTKIIGTPTVLKYPTQNFTTDGNGIYTLPNFEPDTYSLLNTSPIHDLVGTSPALSSFALAPNESKTMQMFLVPHLDRALLVSVKDGAGSPIDGASVRLERTGFDETKMTGTATCPTPGQVFWNGLTSGTYTLTVSAPGFQNNISSFPLSSWQNKEITLMP